MKSNNSKGEIRIPIPGYSKSSIPGFRRAGLSPGFKRVIEIKGREVCRMHSSVCLRVGLIVPPLAVIAARAANGQGSSGGETISGANAGSPDRSP